MTFLTHFNKNNRNYVKTSRNKNNNDNEEDTISPQLYALAARLNIRVSHPKLLLQAVTHKTYDNTTLPSSEGFRVLGNHALGLYVTEYLHIKYPLIPLPCLQKALTGYCGHVSLAAFGQEVGLQHVVRWHPITDEYLYKHSKIYSNMVPEDKPVKIKQVTISNVIAESVQSIIGILYKDNATQKFIHDHILSREVKIQDTMHLEDPQKELFALMRRKERAQPIARLKGESGALSSNPVFVVGIYSDIDQLGEGYGSSKKMAEFRAFRDALHQYYLKEVKDFTLPSSVNSPEAQANFKPTEIGDTTPKL
ncbi:5067_t:CDS:2 [Diversispora eburnea]|uniref:Large ribosomal subunit protein mL44 n=1 Tax=Diversispora eburnea TaxID=1213867 RepID=A0A9N9A9K8_9GLOM|nr:5067_t:CDS:2 [Diversispora eburnea]